MKHIFFIPFLLFGIIATAQIKTRQLNSLEFSIPLIINNSQATYYVLGSPKYPTGSDLSYGINLSYSRIVYKDFYAIIGVGYFKQNFEIKRPFDYTPPDSTKPLVYTENYSYSNIHLLLGLGYRKVIAKKFLFNGKALYSFYNSYRQKYTQTYFPNNNEINKKSFSLGNTITFDCLSALVQAMDFSPRL